MGGRTESGTESQLRILITQAGRQRLQEIVEEHLAMLTDRDVLQILRHPYLSLPVIELILGVRKFWALKLVRKLVALHPASPRIEALQCLDDLSWRDLLDISREARTPMPVRLVASQKILERLPRLSLGERVTLARLADRPVIPVLLRDPEVSVFSAVLRNPRLLPDDLVAWISTRKPRPDHLGIVAGDERWVCRTEIRRALLECREAPRAVALGLLSRCSRAELEQISGNPSMDRLVSACARALMAGDGVAID